MDELRTAIEQALERGRFFVSGQGDLQVIHRPRETIPWEVYRGHLQDESRTRLRREFETWDVFVRLSTAPRNGPLLSVKYAADENKLYVVRYLLVHGWQAYEASPGVIESRPTEKEMPELVGTIDLERVSGPADLHAELSTYLFLAVVGTSRLPLTSLESPLPAFSFGQLMYWPKELPVRQWAAGAHEPLRDPLTLIGAASSVDLTLSQRAKLIEAALRAVEPTDVPRLAESLMVAWSDHRQSEDQLPAVLRTLFNDVALSPYTAFADNLVALLGELARPQRLGVAPVIDVFSYMLRYLTRHLTAYDLIAFHNMGANYPDALLLDSLLKAYLELIELRPHEFTRVENDDPHMARLKRCRRRALRQACLLRKRYEGHLVPDAPTSLGENLRVLPEPYMRVPERQITEPRHRRRQLYRDDPLESLLTPTVRQLLSRSIDDLEQREDLKELGMAIYLDRPLGIFKEPGEVDRTPLLSYEAFSRQNAAQRLKALYRWGFLESEQRLRQLLEEIQTTTILGYPVTKLPGVRQSGGWHQRPGVVALEDAHQAADDFLFLRTSRRSLREFLREYDWHALASASPDVMNWLCSNESVLLIRTAGAEVAATAGPFLVAYDRRMNPRLELGLAATSPPRYRLARGVEYLERGLRVICVWKADATRVELPDCEICFQNP